MSLIRKSTLVPLPSNAEIIEELKQGNLSKVIENSQQGRTFKPISNDPIIGKNSEDTLSHVAVLIFKNRSSLGHEKLVDFDTLLDKKITILEEKQRGFFGFFRKLFTNITSEKKSLEFLKTVVQVSIEEVSLPETKQSLVQNKKSPSTLPKTLPLPLQKPENKSSSIPPPSSYDYVPTPQPQIRRVPSPPIPNTIPPPPPNSNSIPLPPNSIPLPPNSIPLPPTAPSQNGPPAPPNAGTLSPLGMGAVLPPKLFANEPVPLSKIGPNAIVPEKYRGVPPEKLKKEIEIIQNYLDELQPVLASIRELIEDVASKENQLKELISLENNLRREYKTYVETNQVLKSTPKDEIAYLQYVNKKTKASSNTPFFPEALRKEINEKREIEWQEKRGATNTPVTKESPNMSPNGDGLMKRTSSLRPTAFQLIPETLSKEKAIQKFEQLAAKTKKKADEAKLKIKDLRLEIAEIRTSKNNGNPFESFPVLLAARDKQVALLVNGLKNRQLELSEGEKPKVIEKPSEEILGNSESMVGENDFNSLPQDVFILLKNKAPETHENFLQKHLIEPD